MLERILQLIVLALELVQLRLVTVGFLLCAVKRALLLAELLLLRRDLCFLLGELLHLARKPLRAALPPLDFVAIRREGRVAPHVRDGLLQALGLVREVLHRRPLVVEVLLRDASLLCGLLDPLGEVLVALRGLGHAAHLEVTELCLEQLYLLLG